MNNPIEGFAISFIDNASEKEIERWFPKICPQFTVGETIHINVNEHQEFYTIKEVSHTYNRRYDDNAVKTFYTWEIYMEILE